MVPAPPGPPTPTSLEPWATGRGCVPGRQVVTSRLPTTKPTAPWGWQRHSQWIWLLFGFQVNLRGSATRWVKQKRCDSPSILPGWALSPLGAVALAASDTHGVPQPGPKSSGAGTHSGHGRDPAEGGIMPWPGSAYHWYWNPNPAFPMGEIGVLLPPPRASQRRTWQSHQSWSLICYHHEVGTAFSIGQGGKDLGMNKVWGLMLRGSRYNGRDRETRTRGQSSEPK